VGGSLVGRSRRTVGTGLVLGFPISSTRVKSKYAMKMTIAIVISSLASYKHVSFKTAS
jgi:hypothetical protein